MSEATRSGSDQGTDRELEKSLREEVEDLGRLVEEQDRTIAALRDESLRYRVGLGSRLSKRLEKARQRILRIPVVARSVAVCIGHSISGWTRVCGHLRQGAAQGLSGRARAQSPRRGTRWAAATHRGSARNLIRRHEAPDRHEAEAAIARFRETPLISVLAALEGADPARVERALATPRGSVV